MVLCKVPEGRADNTNYKKKPFLEKVLINILGITHIKKNSISPPDIQGEWGLGTPNRYRPTLSNPNRPLDACAVARGAHRPQMDPIDF